MKIMMKQLTQSGAAWRNFIIYIYIDL